MNGNLMYEVARERIADQRRVARQAGVARELRAIARGRHARDEAQKAIATPVIPDFAEQMFDSALGAVPTPRQEAARGRHARTSR